METNDRPRKKIQESGKAASRRKSAVSRGATAGSLKGRPLADEGRTGREKPSLAAARRTSSDAEQSPSRRKDLPLPLERPDREDRREDRSLRLTLRVEGERITVVNAMAGTKWERNHPRRDQVNDRLENQNRRINRELHKGEITKGEAHQLHSEDRAIRGEERTMSKLNNGHITPAEQKSLNQQENAVSRQIGH